MGGGSGSVYQCISGSVVQWFSGSVVQWFSGSVVQWFSVSVYQCISVSVFQCVHDFSSSGGYLKMPEKSMIRTKGNPGGGDAAPKLGIKRLSYFLQQSRAGLFGFHPKHHLHLFGVLHQAVGAGPEAPVVFGRRQQAKGGQEAPEQPFASVVLPDGVNGQQGIFYFVGHAFSEGGGLGQNGIHRVLFLPIVAAPEVLDLKQEQLLPENAQEVHPLQAAAAQPLVKAVRIVFLDYPLFSKTEVQAAFDEFHRGIGLYKGVQGVNGGAARLIRSSLFYTFTRLHIFTSTPKNDAAATVACHFLTILP